MSAPNLPKKSKTPAIGKSPDSMYLRKLLLPLLSLVFLPLHAQCDTLPEKSFLDLNLSCETSLGSGVYSPYYLVSNRHGLLDRQANTGFLRADLKGNRQSGDWTLTSELDLLASAHANASFSIHQLYAMLSWRRMLNLTIGSREQGPLLRDFRLSSGSVVWSGNARPIPQIHLGTNSFIYVPYTKEWVEFFCDIHYGRYLDDDYIEQEYARYVADKTGYGRSWITTHVWSHQKRAFLRTNHQKPWVFTFSGEHAVQFGGNTRNALEPDLADASYPPSFTDFLRVLLPIEGGKNAAGGDQNFKYGNHIGMLSALLEYQWGDEQQCKIGVYGEDLFEDGSGVNKNNGWDGLWGIEFHHRNPRSWLTGLVFEYLQTTDQSGPIHWAPSDFGGQEISTQMPHSATGMDDYYNNYFYTGYTHFGFACGTPMLKSPAFNADHYLRFTDNRVRAWHMGVEGCLFDFSPSAVSDPNSKLDYRLLFSYRESLGTYFVPHAEPAKSLNALFELNFSFDRFKLSAGYAFDHGELYGENHALALSCSYRFSLLH